MLNIIDLPIYKSLTEYNGVIDRIVEKLSSIGSIETIYQVGGIHDPGISDIDLLIIFKNDCYYTDDPLDFLLESEKYFFTHQIFGISVEHFKKIQNCSYFQNYSLLYGPNQPYNTCRSRNQIQQQNLALQYLIKMWISLTIQLKYGMLKLRSFFLEVQAIKLDLKILDSQDITINKLVDYFIFQRKSYFNLDFNRREFVSNIGELGDSLKRFLEQQLRRTPVFLSSSNRIRLAKNIVLLKSSNFFSCKHKGFVPNLWIDSRKYFNLLHRFNRFEFYFPFSSVGRAIELIDIAKLEKERNDYNRLYLKKLHPIKSPLILQ